MHAYYCQSAFLYLRIPIDVTLRFAIECTAPTFTMWHVSHDSLYCIILHIILLWIGLSNQYKLIMKQLTKLPESTWICGEGHASCVYHILSNCNVQECVCYLALIGQFILFHFRFNMSSWCHTGCISGLYNLCNIFPLDLKAMYPLNTPNV